MIYLFEPYNAYQRPPKKKHWTQIAEEEALLVKMQLEEQARNLQEQAQREAIEKSLYEQAINQHLALREATAKQQAQQTSMNNQNLALPQYFPQPAQQQVQDGQYAAPAGGGGWILPQELEKTEEASFTATPQSGYGPLTVTFVNLTPTPDNDTFYWDLGSGSLTSTLVTPAPLEYTQTGSYTVTLQSTSSTGNMTVTSKTVTVSAPTLTATLDGNTFNLTATGFTASFTSSVSYNGNGTLNGLWVFGDGNTTSYTNDTPLTHSYGSLTTYTATLSITESSYNIKSNLVSANIDPYTNKLVLI
jgi:hypothetical protein